MAGFLKRERSVNLCTYSTSPPQHAGVRSNERFHCFASFFFLFCAFQLPSSFFLFLVSFRVLLCSCLILLTSQLLVGCFQRDCKPTRTHTHEHSVTSTHTQAKELLQKLLDMSLTFFRCPLSRQLFCSGSLDFSTSNDKNARWPPRPTPPTPRPTPREETRKSKLCQP